MNHTTMATHLIQPLQIEKPWGVRDLPHPFKNQTDGHVGEIWFTPEYAPLDPLMVKYLFTDEALSIQVHPDDSFAQATGYTRGKEECWFILSAAPDAVVGIGTIIPMSAEELRAAAIGGTLDQFIQWHPARPGMFFHIPAGTIHAIGAGITLVEIQQNVNITYRLFDFGRGRDLHLEEAISASKAAKGIPCRGQAIASDHHAIILNGKNFTVAHISSDDMEVLNAAPVDILVTPLDGEILIDGIRIQSGECAKARRDQDFQLSKGSRHLIAWPNA
jgi:mannose-6-phosphate isomerase